MLNICCDGGSAGAAGGAVTTTSALVSPRHTGLLHRRGPQSTGDGRDTERSSALKHGKFDKNLV